MRPNNRPSAPSSGRPEFVNFLLRRRTRILFTVLSALAADYAGGRILQFSLDDVHRPTAFVGLACVLFGCALLAWIAGGKRGQSQTISSPRFALAREPGIVGLLLAMFGALLLSDNPKTICLLIGPLILLDLVRLRHTDLSTLQNRDFYAQARTRRSSYSASSRRGTFTNLLRSPSVSRFMATPSGRYASLQSAQTCALLLMMLVVLAAVVAYAWPFDSLEFHESWEIRCLLISFIGLGCRILAAGQEPGSDSDRGGRHSAATLTTDGIYSTVRHPRVLGDYFIGLGAVLIPFVVWLPLVYSLAFYVYYRRIIRVEEMRMHGKFGPRFDKWAKATPAMIPRLSLWRKPSHPFSWRTAIKLEHPAFFVVILLHSSIEWLEHLILDQNVMLEIFWLILALTGLSTYLLVRFLSKHTRVLNVQA
jgi:protein-S-isoprenylcysteine O-methyltransferase Ste14